MSQKKVRPGDWAFWSYDRFPYVLSGQIKEVRKDGVVFCTTYDGMGFRPFHTERGEEGMFMHNALQRLEAKMNEAKRNVHDDMARRLVFLFPEIKKGRYKGWRTSKQQAAAERRRRAKA